MSHSPISPSLAQFEQIISYLQMLPRKIRHRGSALAKGGAVRRLWWQSVNRVLMAKVQGTGLHTQSMRFSESGVSVANCTCPYGEDCKHAAAALITFCAGWVGPGPDLKSDDDDYSGEADAEDEDEDEDEGRTGRSANPSAAPTRPGRLPAKPASKPARSTPDPTTLAYALSARFGRKLTAAEQKQTTLIDQLYRNGGHTVSADVLKSIAGQPKSYYHRNLFTPRNKPVSSGNATSKNIRDILVCCLYCCRT